MEAQEAFTRETLLAWMTRMGRKGLSFVELLRAFPDARGDYALEIRENLVLWVNLSRDAVRVITEALRDKAVEVRPTHLLVYVIDGTTLDLPIAKKARGYKKLHWLPAVLNVGPATRDER